MPVLRLQSWVDACKSCKANVLEPISLLPNHNVGLPPGVRADEGPSGCLQGTNAHAILAQKPSALQRQTATALSWSRVRHWCHVRVHSFLHTIRKPLTSGEALVHHETGEY